MKLNRKIGGEYTRENAGMSSEKVSEKLRPKGVGDGQQVEIPVLLVIA